MTSRLGNVSPFKKSKGTGSGAPHRRAPFGHITIGGKAGDIQRVSSDELFAGFAIGSVLLQTTGNSVSVFYTLADIDLALSPAQDSGAHWISFGAVAPGSIQEIPLGTAYRVDFSGNAVVYMSGV